MNTVVLFVVIDALVQMVGNRSKKFPLLYQALGMVAPLIT